MSESLSGRRMAENEVMFRQSNERTLHDMEQVQKIAHSHNQGHLVPEDDMPLRFYCECSNEDCRERIWQKPSAYRKVHKQRDVFIVCPGHDQPSIERIVSKTEEYWTIQKFSQPPETASRLHNTKTD